MNKSIQVSELKDGQIAITTDWSPSICVGLIVQNVNGKLYQLGKDNDHHFPGALNNKHANLQVRVLRPDTILKLTDNGLVIVSEPAQPLFISEDGYEIYPDTTVYVWNHQTKTHGFINKMKASCLGEHTYKEPNSVWKIFMFEYNMNTYIQNNTTRLITDDNVELKKGDKYWIVTKYNNTFTKTIHTVPGHSVNKQPTSYAYFSSEAKAQEYIDKNRIYLTTEDGVGIKKGDTFWYIRRYIPTYVNSNVELGWSIYDHYEYVYFSSYEKAKEYMDKKNIKFSQTDLENFLKHDGQSSQDTIHRLKEYLKNK